MSVERKITYQWERLSRLLTEPNINDLFRAHWSETGIFRDRMPLDPDYAIMLDGNERGLYLCWTARDGKTLVGYLFFWVKPHPHFKSTLVAFDDIYRLSPEYRRGLAGYKMFTTAIEALKARGVKCVRCEALADFQKERGGLDSFYKRLGFTHAYNSYIRML